MKFTITESELNKATDFCNSVKVPSSPSDVDITFEALQGSGIGIQLFVHKGGLCKDITDYENW